MVVEVNPGFCLVGSNRVTAKLLDVVRFAHRLDPDGASTNLKKKYQGPIRSAASGGSEPFEERF